MNSHTRLTFVTQVSTCVSQYGSSVLWRYLVHFLNPTSKKRNPPRRKSLIFPEMEPLTLLRNFLYFIKKSFSYILENGTFFSFRKWKLSKLLIFQEVTFQARKMKKDPILKKLLIFRKWNFLATKKTRVFLGEPLRVFQHCFVMCFHLFTTDFDHCFLGVFIVFIFSPLIFTTGF